jgi:hypothetical protein
MQMGLVAGGCDQRAAFHFGEAMALEMGANGSFHPTPLEQQGQSVGMVLGIPPRHLRGHPLRC